MEFRICIKYLQFFFSFNQVLAQVRGDSHLKIKTNFQLFRNRPYTRNFRIPSNQESSQRIIFYLFILYLVLTCRILVIYCYKRIIPTFSGLKQWFTVLKFLCQESGHGFIQCIWFKALHQTTIDMLRVAVFLYEGSTRMVKPQLRGWICWQGSFPHKLLDWGPHFLTGSWLGASLSSLPYGPFNWAGYNMAAGVLMVMERMRVPKTEPVFCNLILEVFCYLCNILFAMRW